MSQSPAIIHADQHGIRQDQVCSHALTVTRQLHRAGFRSYLVGGCVRDLLLGHRPKDFDVATDARPEQVKHVFRNCRLIGRRFRLAHVRIKGNLIEVATFRGQSDEGDRHLEEGRLVRDNVFGTEEEDALRRDFTANALFFDPEDNTVIDYVGGFDDVRQGRLKLIGDPATRYREDPVRMLRAVRFCSSRPLTMEAETAAPIEGMSDLLRNVASARLFEEVNKLFMTGAGWRATESLVRYGLFQQLFPDVPVEIDPGGAVHLPPVLDQALRNTDDRVARGLPVTPGFLFAALLWEPLKRRISHHREQGLNRTEAILEASEEVIASQVQRVAIPRRFSAMTRTIWLLQPRFERTRGKRALKLLEERKFRAAYDFLLLRSREDPELQELGDWWTRAQTLDDETLREEVMPGSQPAAAGGTGTGGRGG